MLAPTAGFAADDGKAEAEANCVLAALNPDDRDAMCFASLERATAMLEKAADQTDTGKSLTRKILEANMFFAGRVSGRSTDANLAANIAAGKTRFAAVASESQIYVVFGCHAAYVTLYGKL